MRSSPAGQITTIDGNSYSVHTRVQVKNGSGTWINLASLSGYNWIDSVEWDEDIDQPVAQATVTLWREVGALSLAPLDTTSALNRLDDTVTYSPLLNLTREIKIEVATLAANATPGAGDWVLVFHGYIDTIEWPKTESHVRVIARDLGGKLADTFIESETAYGSGVGVAMETVIQSILTNNSTGVTLYTPVSPGFVITTYVQQKESVLDACRTLAQMIGWDVRYKWDSGTSAYRFTLFEPDRTKVAIDKTFAGSFYIDVQQLTVDVAGIRNVVKCIYTDPSSGRTSQSASNAASITKYGRRFMEIEEADDSPINSATEATELVTAAVLDLCEPKATMQIETLFWWPVEMGDLYRFSSNAIHFDSNQDLAVVGYRHALSMNEHRTFITVRGQPCGAYVGWLERDKRVEGEDDRPKRVPAMQWSTLSQSGTTGTATATIDDPDLIITAVEFRTKIGSAAFSAFASTWDTTTGTAGTDTQLVRTESLTIGTKHGSVIQCRVTYKIAGVTQTTTLEHYFDINTAANVTGASISFTTTGAVIVTAVGDEDTANMYVEVTTDGSTPSDPTSGTNDGTISGRSGSVTTAITAADGNTVKAKVRGYNSDPTAGTVFGPISVIYVAAGTSTYDITNAYITAYVDTTPSPDRCKPEITYQVTMPLGYTLDIDHILTDSQSVSTVHSVTTGETTTSRTSYTGYASSAIPYYYDKPTYTDWVTCVMRITMKNGGGTVVKVGYSNAVTYNYVLAV